MNNSFIAESSIDLEPPVDMAKFREQESKMLGLIEAIQTIADSKEWKLLKTEIFDEIVASLNRQRDIEVEKKPLNGPMIHSLNGQLAWAKKYSNFETLANIYKLELQKIRKHLDAT